MGGGFGVGADVDVSLHARLNWDSVKHIRVTFGYGMLYLDSVARRRRPDALDAADALRP